MLDDSVQRNSEKGALCPYFDMINHSVENCNAKYYYTVNFGMTVRATRDILAGDQIFISYSNRSDDDLFMGYGFCQSPGSNKHSSRGFKLVNLQEAGNTGRSNGCRSRFDPFLNP